jgi:hypothetical protein
MMPIKYMKKGVECVARPIEEIIFDIEHFTRINRDNIAPLLSELRAAYPSNIEYGAKLSEYDYFGVHQTTLLRWRKEYEVSNEIEYSSSIMLERPNPLITNEETPEPRSTYSFTPDELPKIAREKFDRLTDANKQAVADKANVNGTRPLQRSIEAVLEEQNRVAKKTGVKPVVTQLVSNEVAKEALDARIGKLPKAGQKVVEDIITEYLECLRKDIDAATDAAFKQREAFLDDREEKLNVLEAHLDRQRSQLYLVVEEEDLKLLRSFCHPDKYQDKETQDKAHKVQLIVQKLMSTYDRGILRDQVANEKKRAASRKRWAEMQERAGYV